ncbi:NADPH-dependent F420 reductase [Spirosoma arcticum]
MTIGIIGTGLIGSNLARLLAKAGHQVRISFSRSPEKLGALAQELAAYSVAVTNPAEAVANSEVVILSIPFTALDTALAQMGDVANKILIDTNNPFGIKLSPGVNFGQEIARRLPGVRLVKAFNSLKYDLLIQLSFQEPLTVLPVSGNDQAANELVAQLIRETGFEPLDLGTLESTGLQEPGGPFFSKVMTLPVAQSILSRQ